MVDTLSINNGESYTVTASQTDEYLNTNINGSLEINGSLVLTQNPDKTTQPGNNTSTPASQDTSDDTGINLKEFENFNTDSIITILGMFALVLYSAVKLRSAMLFFMLSINAIILILVILVDLSIIWLLISLIISFIFVALAGVVANLD